MWDVLRWHNDTLSIAWWAMIGFAILVIIAAGARAAKVAARLLGLSNALLCGLPSHVPLKPVLGASGTAGWAWGKVSALGLPEPES